MTYHIRQAAVSDLETLVSLRMALLRESGLAAHDEHGLALAQATREYFERAIPTGQFRVWIAEAGGQIVASSGLVFCERPPLVDNLSGIEAYVMNMYTLPEWRGRGIATALIAEMVRFAQQIGARRVFLHATPVGEPIYQKIGFVSQSNEMLLKF